MLLELNQPAEAREQFLETLKHTPGRPKAIYGIARAAQMAGDTATARQRYQEFLALWKGADSDLPEIGLAQRFLEEKNLLGELTEQ